MPKLKKIFLTGVVFAVFLLLPIFGFAAANDPTTLDTGILTEPITATDAIEQIDDYQIQLDVQKDGSMLITETIFYNFGAMEKHGIYRDIPYKYKDQRGANYKLRIEVLSIEDEKGRNYTYKKDYSGSNFSLKIGDADKYVGGKKVYVIKYKVERGLTYLKDHDELYWNAIGHGWKVGIEKGLATVTLPQELKENEIKNSCYTGSYGATFHDCEIRVVNNKTFEFLTTAPFSLYSGMTIVVNIPKGMIARSQTQEFIWFLEDNWPVAIPILALIFLFFRWWRRGRDPKGRGTIIAQYEAPDNLRPGEIGTIVDMGANDKDISATIIDLAVRGYMKIKEIEKGEYQFTKLKEGTDLKPFEQNIFNKIFESGGTRLLSALKYHFKTTLDQAKNLLYESLTQQKYFSKNPETVRGGYLVIGIVLAVGSIVLGGVMESGIWLLSFLVTGILFIVFSFFMPSRSQKGAILREQILGFKEFLSVTEKDRLKFHQAPEKKPELFEKFLPYAMVLGVEAAWAKQFEGIYKSEQSSWYETYDHRPFTAYMFVYSLGSLMSATDKTFSAVQPKTSSGSFGGGGGGGFSGGGGGGGGGGSW